jgi:hypothetical protein
MSRSTYLLAQGRRLDCISMLAEDYVGASKAGDMSHCKAIAAQAAKFDAVEMAYFCQHVVSRIDNVHKASMLLTILTNQVLDRMRDPAPVQEV